MKFGVLALDYDGTIARDGALDPDVKAAIVEARARGIVVIIVTGRILSELRQAAGDLEFVDAVVAENGPFSHSQMVSPDWSAVSHLKSSSTNYAAVGSNSKRAGASWKRMPPRLRGFWR